MGTNRELSSPASCCSASRANLLVFVLPPHKARDGGGAAVRRRLRGPAGGGVGGPLVPAAALPDRGPAGAEARGLHSSAGLRRRQRSSGTGTWEPGLRRRPAHPHLPRGGDRLRTLCTRVMYEVIVQPGPEI